ncbi:hypothetical protein ACI65C_013651 [Semiaphis heraclei]
MKNVCDRILNGLKERFDSMDEAAKYFSFLDGKFIFTKTQPVHSAIKINQCCIHVTYCCIGQSWNMSKLALDGFINWKKILVLKAIIDIVMHLAMENSKSNESGKFLNLVNLVSHYNEPLRIHLERHKKGIDYYRRHCSAHQTATNCGSSKILTRDKMSRTKL